MWGALAYRVPQSDMTPQQSHELKKRQEMMKKHHDENCKHKKAREI